MMRKEATEIVEKYIESFEGGASIYEALKMAADALKDENALIDNVLEIIKKRSYGGPNINYDQIKADVLRLKGGEQE